jgi:hypothetical protein
MKAESGYYTDCHCWKFTDDEFFAVVSSIINMFSIPLEIIDLKRTRPNTTEFYVTLEKRD